MRISDWSSDVCSSDLATRGLYPPGSTLKPMAAIAAIEHGVDPSERHTCIGGYRLGNRFFRCLGTHGSLDMPSAIMKSCNSYFYWLAHRLGYDAMAPPADRQSVVWGKRVSGRVDLGGHRIIKIKKQCVTTIQLNNMHYARYLY